MVAFDNFMVFSFERINNKKLLLFQSKKKSKINMLCSKIFRKSLHWSQVLLLLLLL